MEYYSILKRKEVLIHATTWMEWMALEDIMLSKISQSQKSKYMGKEMATHSSILAWKSPWTEEPGGLQSMGSHD